MSAKLGIKKSICIEFDPGSYVINYGFIYALCGGQRAWDFYMVNANFLSLSALQHIDGSAF